MKNQGLKIGFGALIFLFSIALAYASAWYFDGRESGGGGIFNALSPSGNFDAFWITLLIFGGAYILIGIIVARVYPVSLGFLFASDVVLLHVLNNQYGGFDNGIKSLIIFVLLVILYLFAFLKLQDKSHPASSLQNAA
jgi:uncharacterized membrane protein